ncbi:MAG: glutamate-5-semialdehyde dehydrogenase [Rhodospirillaceae bacterium]|nr:glutamate-5-semialdehyde dehydrogenase [Rhodospirillaceae bacterium]
MAEIGAKAATAANDLKKATPDQKNMALRQAAGEIRKNSAYILKANVADLEFASNKQLRESLLDRLKLDTNRLENIAEGLETIAELPDPIGTVLNKWERPNGLIISRVRVPLGVIGIIYESRPNVTADAGGLCLKSGNSTILRGGSESINTSQALVECLQIGLAHSNLPRTAVQLIPTRNRDAVGHLLRMTDYVDIIVPRGGKSLVERVQKESRIPTIAHLEGICHVYLDDSADLLMACEISLNAKMRRPGVCGAMETLLVDKAAASRILPSVAEQLFAAGCTLKGDKDSRMLIPEMEPASEIDWTTEYLDTILAVKLVDGVQGAIDHINAYGSNHTDSIVTNDEAAAERFLGEVDSAIVLHNASTQYADGGEFGMGAEIGISTGRLHARGPVGADQLTCFKYVVRGNGQIRP